MENHPLILFSARNGGVDKDAWENDLGMHAIVRE
jgi:hypothetical protein